MSNFMKDSIRVAKTFEKNPYKNSYFFRKKNPYNPYIKILTIRTFLKKFVILTLKEKSVQSDGKKIKNFIF